MLEPKYSYERENLAKKIVAIGGGFNGSKKSDGALKPYETFDIDCEIIKLTGKQTPVVLIIAHAKPLEKQERYYQDMCNIFEKRFGCECKFLKSDELTNIDKVNELVRASDIIYESGGNTFDMIQIWQKTGFDHILKQAWENGKIICGVSAGASCWFTGCLTDRLQMLYGPNQPLVAMDCLDFIHGFFVPHADEDGRYETAKQIVQENDSVAILCSNCCAVEIVDNQYRIIIGDGTYRGIKPYALKLYYKDGKFVEEKLKNYSEFKSLDDLLSKGECKNHVRTKI